MIFKIERLSSIGKFRNYQASGDVSFKKLTLLYAENGTGKTTLTSILRSLTSGKPDIIGRRVSTASTLPQAAQILQRNISGDVTHTYRSTGWSNPFPDIEIFDIHFINENIYSGFTFNDNHRKQLHEFVVGAQGITISQSIEQNKQDKSSCRQVIGDLEGRIVALVANGIDTVQLQSFISIHRNELLDIDAKIQQGESSLASAKANQIIQSLQLLKSLEQLTFNINFELLKSDLRSSVNTIQDESLRQIFDSHCLELSNNEIPTPESWIHTGLNYVNSKKGSFQESQILDIKCPFCRQPLDEGLQSLQVYSQKFNDVFNSLLQRIQSHQTALASINYQSLIQGLKNIIQSNQEKIQSWNTHLSGITSPSEIIEPIYEAFVSSLIAAGQAVLLKMQNPSIENDSEAVTQFENSTGELNSCIRSYNQIVETFNSAIRIFRSRIITEQQAQLELSRLKRIKRRFDTDIDTLCTQLSTEKQRLRNLDNDYSQLVQQQEVYASSFFNQYKDRINHYLTNVFKTAFTIDNVAHVAPQGRGLHSKINYALIMDGNAISFDETQPNNTKDCLSEGDKSTLALAFFLSKLDIDPNKSNKVLVFDDPLSSFDSNRRFYTVQLIKDLLPEIKQVIVLSHSEFFLHDLTKDIAVADKKTLRIMENFVTKASSIVPLDLDELVEIEYFRHVKELEDFITNADIRKKERILGLMRNVLEAHIRFKFYRQTCSIPENQRTFGRLINTLETSPVSFRDSSKPQIISKLKLINGVSCKPHHGEPLPDYGSLEVDPNSISTPQLVSLVQDTLDLVDNKL